MIFVTNKNDFEHVDRYDGVDYSFPPNESIPVDEAAAQHMFGYGLPDKTPVLHRLGWASYFDEEKKRFVENKQGPVQLAKFVFSQGEFVKMGRQAEEHAESGDLLEDSPI